jgi:hypothetical protein
MIREQPRMGLATMRSAKTAAIVRRVLGYLDSQPETQGKAFFKGLPGRKSASYKRRYPVQVRAGPLLDFIAFSAAVARMWRIQSLNLRPARSAAISSWRFSSASARTSIRSVKRSAAGFRGLPRDLFILELYDKKSSCQTHFSLDSAYYLSYN